VGASLLAKLLKSEVNLDQEAGYALIGLEALAVFDTVLVFPVIIFDTDVQLLGTQVQRLAQVVFDLIMGCERRVVYDFVNVVNGEANLQQALIKDKRLENLYVLAASQTRDKDALTVEGVEKVLMALKEDFEYVVCDSPAGIEKGAHLAMYFADEAIIVTNPEVSSVRDSDRMLGLLASKSRRAEKGEEAIKEHLLLTRYNPQRVSDGEMLGVEDVKEILAVALLGVIPESQAVLKASNSGVPVILDDQSDAGQAYSDAVDRLLGKTVEHRFLDVTKKGFFERLFGGR
jgi:septum site-determining protein MinD